jgi:hypothetical protein
MSTPPPPVFPDGFDFRIARLNLRKGDTAVMKVTKYLAPEVRESLYKWWEEFFPNHKLIILEGDIELCILHEKAGEKL